MTFTSRCKPFSALILGSVIVLVSGHLIASSSPGSEPIVRTIFFNDGDVLSGQIMGEAIHILEGQTIMVDGDLILEATGWLRLDGKLLAIDADILDKANANAPTIALSSDSRITITGTVRGGRGRSYSGVPLSDSLGLLGGNGSDISVSAPDVLLAATGGVFGGDGGQGGAGAAGGEGGSIQVTGSILSDHGLQDLELQMVSQGVGFVGGDGGDGGRGLSPLKNGGKGGDSGGVYRLFFEEKGGSDTDDENLADQDSALSPRIADCSDGIAGIIPAPSSSGDGGNGGDGTPGSSGSPNGGHGEAGGNARPSTGARAGDSGDGQDCCVEPQGKGGDGGVAASGGTAAAGNGGKGGNGGNAHSVAGHSPPYQGIGGNGGKGGNGGDATGGRGGDGGDGGDGVPPGGPAAGGASGSATGGAKGSGGAKGEGNPSGVNGGEGNGGSGASGATGNGGNWGVICPSGGG